jgi:ureidoglycolate lyase
MKLVRFSQSGAAAQPGLLIGDSVVPLTALAPDAPSDMVDVIARWDTLAPRLAGAATSSAARPLSDVRLEAPIAAPGKVMAIGLNYTDHIEEARGSGVVAPKDQVWFAKIPSSVNGPFGDVEFPKAGTELDYEVELVAVIGKGGRHITREDAPAAVFGYCVGNDVSVRDWQLRTTQWILGKSFDTHCPFGPAITTADEVGDPHRLSIKCWLNGELRQNSNTRFLLFNVWDQIAELSKVMALKPGDLIFTGTPGGVGMATKPDGYMKVGDKVRCEIEELGAIENTIVAEA